MFQIIWTFCCAELMQNIYFSSSLPGDLSIYLRVTQRALLIILSKTMQNQLFPNKCKEKCFQMMSSAHLHNSKAPQNVMMLMIHLRKRQARRVTSEQEIHIETANVSHKSSLPVLRLHSKSVLKQDSDYLQKRPIVEKNPFACDCYVTIRRRVIKTILYFQMSHQLSSIQYGYGHYHMTVSMLWEIQTNESPFFLSICLLFSLHQKQLQQQILAAVSKELTLILQVKDFGYYIIRN